MQIGPRIRVGGTLGKIGEGIKHNIPSPAGMLMGASPILSAIAYHNSPHADPMQDLKIGARNAAIIAPATAAMNGGGSGSGGAGTGGGGVGSRVPTDPSSILKMLSSVGGDDGGMSWLDKLLMGGGIAAAAEDSLHRRKLADSAADYARGSYDSRAPLRERALKLLENPAEHDNSGLFEDPGNPYDGQRRRLAAGVA